MDTILMTGVTGFAGRYIANAILRSGRYKLVATGRQAIKPGFLSADTDYYAADITDSTALTSMVAELNPAIVLHSAAISKPNDCEEDKVTAYALNVKPTHALVDACNAIGSKLVFMSTDFVFGHDGPYAETDATCPVNYYGETKALSEQYIIASGVPYLIIRTVLVYGKPFAGQGPSFVQWVANNLAAGKPISVYTDQHRTATYVNDLANAVLLLLQQQGEGIFHVCGEEIFTPHNMAMIIANHLNLDTSLISETTALQRPEPAMRPQASTLKIDKLKQATGFEPTPFHIALNAIFEQP